MDEEDVEEDEAVYGGAQSGSVLLGVLSGPLEEPYLNDVTTSRAGGAPIWAGGKAPKGAVEPPTCRLCNSPLWLVAQMYAPLAQHRVLHVFGCNHKGCSARKGECCQGGSSCCRIDHRVASRRVVALLPHASRGRRSRFTARCRHRLATATSATASARH
jgi:hypothetical protein